MNMFHDFLGMFRIQVNFYMNIRLFEAQHVFFVFSTKNMQNHYEFMPKNISRPEACEN